MKNTMTVQILATEDGINFIKKTPTLKQLFHTNQLNWLKPNMPLILNVSKPTYSRMMNMLNLQSGSVKCSLIKK